MIETVPIDKSTIRWSAQFAGDFTVDGKFQEFIAEPLNPGATAEFLHEQGIRLIAYLLGYDLRVYPCHISPQDIYKHAATILIDDKDIALRTQKIVWQGNVIPQIQVSTYYHYPEIPNSPAVIEFIHFVKIGMELAATLPVE